MNPPGTTLTEMNRFRSASELLFISIVLSNAKVSRFTRAVSSFEPTPSRLPGRPASSRSMISWTMGSSSQVSRTMAIERFFFDLPTLQRFERMRHVLKHGSGIGTGTEAQGTAIRPAPTQFLRPCRDWGCPGTYPRPRGGKSRPSSAALASTDWVAEAEDLSFSRAAMRANPVASSAAAGKYPNASVTASINSKASSRCGALAFRIATGFSGAWPIGLCPRSISPACSIGSDSGFDGSPSNSSNIFTTIRRPRRFVKGSLCSTAHKTPSQ